MDNIYTNLDNFKEGIAGNLTLSISDHLAQFLIIPHSTNHIPKKHQIYTRDTKHFDRENFMLELLSVDWNQITFIEQRNPNVSFNSLFKTVDDLVDKYLPLRKVTKKELRTQKKPWITNEIQNQFKIREKLKRKFIKAKDKTKKEQYHNDYKSIRNQIVTLCREKKK